MEQKKRTALISEIAVAESENHLGKTAMMKLLFILQRVYRVPLDYNFSIYTYGPYCADVMADIDVAAAEDAISVSKECYQPNIIGYNITPAEKATDYIKKEQAFLKQYQAEIDEVVKNFGDKNAKDLELYSTVVYIYSTFCENGWPLDVEEICNNVHVIKPHFPKEAIKRAYRYLEKKEIFSKMKS